MSRLNRKVSRLFRFTRLFADAVRSFPSWSLFLGSVFAAIFVLGPPLLVFALFRSAQRLRKRSPPHFAFIIANALTATVSVIMFAAYVGAFVAWMRIPGGESDDAGGKARALAEGISEMMNLEAIALLVAIIAAFWSRFWKWRLGE